MQLLRSSHWQVGIAAASGGSLAYGLIRLGAGWYDFLRPTPPGSSSVKELASFIMTPWCNRIRAGQFSFAGQSYQLRQNNADGTAIHGVGRDHAWTIAEQTPTRLTLTLDSRVLDAPNFPFAFTAQQIFTVDGPRFSIATTLTNVDARSFPAGFGHHPYFVRTLTSPTDRAALELPYARHYPLENALPTGAIDPVDARLDFRTLRELSDDFIDDVLTDRQPTAPIRIRYAESGAEVRFEADPIFAHLVVFAPIGKPFFAVEPVTNVNDGVNLLAHGHPQTGVIVLEPGASASGTVALTIAE